jgi:hypothetical protein
MSNTIIQGKAYQRIDGSGYWLETVTVTPTVTPLDDGSYQIEYVTGSDLIEADVPENLEAKWNGNDWQLPEVVVPPMPEAVMMRHIDADGYFIGDVILLPELIENVWVYPGIDSPDYIAELVPQEAAFYRPRWVGGQWVEGATKAEMTTVPSPDWGRFLIEFTASSLDEMIAQPTNIVNVLRLNRLLSMYPNLSVPDVLSAWNQCLDGLETQPNKDQRKELIKIIESCNLPIVIDSDCKLSEVTYGG